MAKIAQGSHGRSPYTFIGPRHMAAAMRRSGAAFLMALALLIAALTPASSIAAPYAAMVMDARTGKVLHSRNADTRLHPASLTKMMTLYIAFEAVRNGEISLDKKITISRNAAAEPPSELGLRTGQKIALRYLLRAAAVKSANDAATAIGEAISGSEAAFARRMTRTAKSLGMTRTTFKNAHGLTAKGHQSTARDMTILGRHILYDYPEYYNLFSRTSTDAGLKVVYNTNRRLLGNYRGADGIKTGYTRAAGYNLVASAKRGNERIIATVFGGKSTASRNAKVAELLDLGFRRAPSYAKLRKPALPRYTGNKGLQVADAGTQPALQTGPLKSTIRPRMRPASLLVATATPAPQDPELQNSINSLLAEVSADANTEAATEIEQLSVSAQDIAAPESAPRPIIDLRPRRETAAAAETAVVEVVQEAPAVLAKYSGPRPRMRPADLTTRTAAVAPEEPVLVTRISTSGGRYWGINVGRYASRYQAEKVLLRTALSEMESLDGSLRKVVQSPRGFDAHFLGMTQEGAENACNRLRARNVSCDTLGPS